MIKSRKKRCINCKYGYFPDFQSYEFVCKGNPIMREIPMAIVSKLNPSGCGYYEDDGRVDFLRRNK